MRRATVTIPSHLEDALEEFQSSLPARPSLASVVEAALEAYLDGPPAASSRLPAVMRSRARIVESAHARGARRIGLFGSVASASDGPDSDIDFWVEIGPGMGLFELAALRHDLREELGAPVDVVTLGGLSEDARDALVAKSLVL